MKKKEVLLIICIAAVVTAIFFYKTILHHQIPFPGDLLVNQAPYKSESFLGYAPGGYPTIDQGKDVISQLYPWKYFTIEELKAGRIPFWNPYNFSGTLHMQNYQTGVFYPFNILFFLLSFTNAWSLYIMSQPFLAILFMFLFLRSISLGKMPAIIGAIAFGFSSYMTVWIEYGNIGSTLLWLPLILFASKKFIEERKIRYFLLAIASLTISFLAGYIQGIFYIYSVSIFYCVFLCIQNRLYKTKPLIASLFLLFTFPVFLCAFQLLPTYDLFSRSTRNPYSLSQIENLLQPMYYWVTVFVPDFFGNPAHRNYFLPITYIERVMYVGIPLLFFVFFAIEKSKNKSMKFFLFLGLLFLILTTNLPLIKYLYLIPIPMISTTIPTRALSIFIFCMIIVACFGIQHWIEQEKKEKTIVPFIFLGIYLLFWISVLVLSKMLPHITANKSIIFHNLVIPTIIACITAGIFYCKRFSVKIAVLVLTLLVIADLFFFFEKITPFAPSSLVYPKTPVISWLQAHAGINRFWGYGSGYIAPNFQTYDGTYSPEGNDPLHSRDYGILLASSLNGSYPDRLPRPDANIAPGYGLTDMRNPYRQKILNLLGIKYILYEDDSLPNTIKPHYDIFPEETYKIIWQQKPWQIYENKQVLPRFFLTSHVSIIPRTKEALAKLYTQNLRTTIMLPKTPLQLPDANATGTAALVHYDPHTVVFKTDTTGNMFLFLSDEYYPSWHVKIDKNDVPVYKANIAFRAVEVPKGKHTVTFVYQPESFKNGLIIAGGSLLCLGFYIVFFYCYNRKTTKLPG